MDHIYKPEFTLGSAVWRDLISAHPQARFCKVTCQDAWMDSSSAALPQVDSKIVWTDQFGSLKQMNELTNIYDRFCA